jgi:hypothetical protein
MRRSTFFQNDLFLARFFRHLLVLGFGFGNKIAVSEQNAEFNEEFGD